MRYVYYVNVGNLPKEKARKFCEESKNWILESGVFNKHEIAVVAVRDGDGCTRIEALPE